jgi:hypothetical protein
MAADGDQLLSGQLRKWRTSVVIVHVLGTAEPALLLPYHDTSEDVALPISNLLSHDCARVRPCQCQDEHPLNAADGLAESL